MRHLEDIFQSQNARFCEFSNNLHLKIHLARPLTYDLNLFDFPAVLQSISLMAAMWLHLSWFHVSEDLGSKYFVRDELKEN